MQFALILIWIKRINLIINAMRLIVLFMLCHKQYSVNRFKIIKWIGLKLIVLIIGETQIIIK